MKRVLAALLCGTVLISSGMFSPVAYAAEQTTALTVDAESEDGQDEEKETDEASEEGAMEDKAEDGKSEGVSEENETSGNGDSEVSGDGDSKASGDDEAETPALEDNGESGEADNIAEDGTVPGEDETEELSEEAADKILDGTSDKTVEKDLPEGINGLPEGFELSDDDKEMKEEAASHDMLEDFESLSAGEDYADGQVIALADSREEAEAIAYAYSGELLNYEYGVATISLAESGLSVEEAFEYALDNDLSLPYVEPNYIDEIGQPEVMEGEEIDDESGALLGAGKVASGDGFLDWWYSTANQDPLLNPANSAYQWHHGDINTYAAWAVSTGSSNITVAVIDTGVNNGHVDLKDRVITGINDKFLNVSEIKSELSEYQNSLRSGEDSYINGLNNYKDDIGHGTHVAGIIAGSLNGTLGAGIAPGVKIMPLKVGYKYRYGKGTNDYVERMPYSAILKAVNFAVSKRVDIINMSLGGTSYRSAYEQVIRKAHDAGVTIVVSMGNDDNSNTRNYPAAYKGVIAVCSSNENGALSTFSTLGPWADVTAPGSRIYSCDAFNNSGYVCMDGTSMAAPVISGACALYMSVMGHQNPDVMEKVIKSAVTGSAGSGAGAGIIDLAKLFSGDVTAPLITLAANDGKNTVLGEVRDAGTQSVSAGVSPGSKITMKALNFGGQAGPNARTSIVYTTDGKAPLAMNGEILHGEKYTGAITVSSITGDITADTKVTVKAAAVTGLGVMGKVSTITFTVSPLLKAGTLGYTIEITGNPANLIAGKSVTLGAVVKNSSTKEVVSQKVKWKITSKSPALSKAKIDASTGKLTTAAGQTGTITVSCTTADGVAAKSVTMKVIVKDSLGKIVLDKGEQLTFNYNKNKKLCDKNGNPVSNFSVSIASLADSKGKVLANSSYKSEDFQWTSSNKAVADIESLLSFGAKFKITGVGTATITCKALDGSGKSAKLTIKVTSDVKASSIKILNSKKEAVSVIKDAYVGQSAITVYSRQMYPDNKEDNTIAPSWSSSNSKVLKVVSGSKGVATLTPVSKGTATVTCAATDGSGRKATLKVTVLQRAKEITITGQKQVAIGGKVAFKADIAPSTASDKKVVWSLKGSYAGVSINAGTGAVTVDKNAKAGTKVTVVATAHDGSGVRKEAAFTVISQKASGVTIVTSEGKNARNILALKNNAVSSFRVYDTNIVGGSDERNFTLSSRVKVGSNENAAVDVEWKSSNEQIASVQASGSKVTVVGKKAGTATITCTALDGSGKKGSVKVTVITPASGVSITADKGTSTYTDDNGFDYTLLGLGASAKLNIKPLGAYGKPTVSKVDTTYEIGTYSDGKFVALSAANQETLKKGKAFISLSGSKVSVKNKSSYKSDLKKYYGYDSKTVTDYNLSKYTTFAIKVTARTTDGTGYLDSEIFKGIPGTSYVKTMFNYKFINSGYCTLSSAGKGTFVGPITIVTDSYFGSFSVVSSNPNVASGTMSYSSTGTPLLYIYPSSKGTVKLTITALDGSNKKTTFTLQVR